jgi:membrane-associated protein
MDLIHQFFNFILHIDQHMVTFVSLYGTWVYAILFLIIFCETGLIVIAFLPGDSLIFATGAIASTAMDALNIHLLFITLVTASVLGNGVNYLIGKFIGPKIFRSSNSLLFNKKHLMNAHRFYEQYGGKTIIIARFIPILRTFAPFVAGIGYMQYRQFFIYNLIGALLWIGTLLYVGYLFGNLPFIKAHFSTVVLAVIAVSLLPPVLEVLRRRYSSAQSS